MSFKVYFFSVAVFIFSHTLLFPQVGGNTKYNFLNIPASARIAALGGDNISNKDADFSLSLSNPALLTDTMNNNISFNYVNYLSDIQYGNVAFAKNIKPNHNLSFGINYLDYGKFKNADEYGNVNGTFGVNEMSYNVGYGGAFVDSNLTLGAYLKTIYSNFNGYTSWGSTIDLGSNYVIKKYNLSVAALVKNVGFQWTGYTKGNKEKLPLDIQFGATKGLNHAPLKLSVVYKKINQWNLINPNDSISFKDFKKLGNNLLSHFTIGAELNIIKSVSLRLGYNVQHQQELKINGKRTFSGFAFGVGFSLYKIQISYGRAVYSMANGASNTFSIVINPANFYKKKVII